MLAYYHGIAVTPEIKSLGCQCTLFKVILGTKLDAKKGRFSKAGLYPPYPPPGGGGVVPKSFVLKTLSHEILST